jgi:dipeptidase E
MMGPAAADGLIPEVEPVMIEPTSRLLLLSNSRNVGGGYLDHAETWIRTALRGVTRAVFVPYAGVTVTWDEYAGTVSSRFAQFGVSVKSVHTSKHPVREVDGAEAVIVGGGNTFHLLKHLYETGTLWAIRARVLAGVPYLGWSAGSNVACPSIRTTNDMPIVEPARFDAMRLVPFQINPHYTDAVVPNHGGESRAQRIAEFVATNPGVTVVGLREGSAVQVDGAATALLGPHPARIFRSGREPFDVNPGPMTEAWEA